MVGGGERRRRRGIGSGRPLAHDRLQESVGLVGGLDLLGELRDQAVELGEEALLEALVVRHGKLFVGSRKRYMENAIACCSPVSIPIRFDAVMRANASNHASRASSRVSGTLMTAMAIRASIVAQSQVSQ